MRAIADVVAVILVLAVAIAVSAVFAVMYHNTLNKVKPSSNAIIAGAPKYSISDVDIVNGEVRGITLEIVIPIYNMGDSAVSFNDASLKILLVGDTASYIESCSATENTNVPAKQMRFLVFRCYIYNETILQDVFTSIDPDEISQKIKPLFIYTETFEVPIGGPGGIHRPGQPLPT